MNNSQIRRRRRATARAVRIGMRLGLLVFTAYLTARLCRAGLEVISRTEHPAARFSYSLIILLIWTGWTARKEYTDLTKGAEDKHDFRRSNGATRQPEKKHVASWGISDQYGTRAKGTAEAGQDRQSVRNEDGEG